ncbi:MAG: hypothetical protein ACRELY_01005 [Polyangiaceae bacterium]
MSGFTIDDVAEACRSAALELLDGVRDGWGKKELVKWLTGSYHQISILRCSADELAFADVVPHSPRPDLRTNTPSVPPEDIEKTLKSAREEVLAVIERFASGDQAAETFVWRVKSRGGLARVEDENGAPGLVPNEQPSQRLVERVLSLIAADYVARPLDYEDRVAVCHACGSVSFEPGARTACDCGEHRGSGMRPRINVDALGPNDSGEKQTG